MCLGHISRTVSVFVLKFKKPEGIHEHCAALSICFDCWCEFLHCSHWALALSAQSHTHQHGFIRLNKHLMGSSNLPAHTTGTLGAGCMRTQCDPCFASQQLPSLRLIRIMELFFSSEGQVGDVLFKQGTTELKPLQNKTGSVKKTKSQALNTIHGAFMSMHTQIHTLQAHTCTHAFYHRKFSTPHLYNSRQRIPPSLPLSVNSTPCWCG